MTYKEAQKLYGIQGRSTVLVWLRKHGQQGSWKKGFLVDIHGATDLCCVELAI
jgi:transposase